MPDVVMPSPPPPVAPAALAPVAASKPAELPPLDPSVVIDLGGGQAASIGQMAEAFQELQRVRSQPQPPTISPEDLEEVALIRKALKEGDPHAATQLWDKFKPAAPQTPEQQQTLLQERLTRMEQQLQEMSQVAAQGQQAFATQQAASGQQWIAGQLAANKDKYPHLSGHPNGVGLLTVKLNEVEALARARGINTQQMTNPQRLQVITEVFNWLEQETKAIVGWAKTFNVPPNGQPGRPIQAVADQPQSAQSRLEQAVKRARISVTPDGRAYDNVTGQFIDLPAQGAGFVPNAPVNPASGMPVNSLGSPPAGPATVQNLRARMAQRAQEL